MRIKMTNRLYRGEASVLPDNQAQWEAAGWVADKPKKKTKTPPTIEIEEKEPDQ